MFRSIMGRQELRSSTTECISSSLEFTEEIIAVRSARSLAYSSIADALSSRVWMIKGYLTARLEE
jgi:hypothetical protein